MKKYWSYYNSIKMILTVNVLKPTCDRIKTFLQRKPSELS